MLIPDKISFYLFFLSFSLCSVTNFPTFFGLYFLFPITSIRQTITPRIKDGHQEHLLRLRRCWSLFLPPSFLLDAAARWSLLIGRERPASRTMVGVLSGVKGVPGTRNGYLPTVNCNIIQEHFWHGINNCLVPNLVVNNIMFGLVMEDRKLEFISMDIIYCYIFIL